MDPDSAKTVSDIYHAALERQPDERATYLKRACGGDERLERKIESLLRYHDNGEFLEQPAAVIAGRQASMLNRQLGPYTIVAPLGAGGMGEVYRARDPKLSRDVAIKILPAHFIDDPERRARFAREARVLATLNHPHIGAIYGLEEADGVSGLVLELVEGPTLADRLERGPLPMQEALAVARQIGEALGAAHEKGIVHRDLKPANVVLQAAADDVRVKVLDFGLAKSLTDGSEASGPPPFEQTVEGRLLGTPAYMSPEQARGLPVDERTDIWAFGCVLFEMLSGRRVFDATTITDTLARVLEHEPDWSQLPAQTPASVRRLLDRCLRKDPRRRLHDIADALIEVDEVATDAAGLVAAAPSARRRRSEYLAWTLACAAAAAAMWMAAVYSSRSSSPSEGAIEFSLSPPAIWSYERLPAPSFEFAPDGQHVAAAAGTKAQSVSSLWIRPVSTSSWRQLPGTDGVTTFFWSPDSQELGFFADGELKSVRLAGGAPRTICRAQVGQLPSGTWSSDDWIVFGGTSPLFKVPAKGGEPAALTTLASEEIAHRWPSFLPDGQHFLYLSQQTRRNEMRIGSLTSAMSESLGTFQSHARYAGGYLLFVYGGQLMAQRFDADSRRLRGDPVVVSERTAVIVPWLRGQFSASNTGRLAYSIVGRPFSQLTWLDRAGKAVGSVGDAGYYSNLNLNRDNTRVVVSRFTEPPGLPWNVDIWSLGLARPGADRLTLDPSQEFDPVWSPDSKQVAFISSRAGGRFRLFRRAAIPDASDELLLPQPDATAGAPDWSPDGQFILYTGSGSGGADLKVLPLNGDRTPWNFLSTPANERCGEFSPDGRWVAYESNTSGRPEVYVRPFPSGDEQHPISSGGGRAARWRADGTELFYLAPDGTMMAARVDAGSSFRSSLPRPLFKTGITTTTNNYPYDVRRDGQQFLIPVILNEWTTAPINVVLNWPARLLK